VVVMCEALRTPRGIRWSGKSGSGDEIVVDLVSFGLEDGEKWV
jgi:hypothetical protein